MRILKLLLICIALLIFAYTEVSAEENDSITRAQILMQDFFEAGNSPGMAVSVAAGSDIVWSAGFGMADVEQGVPVVAASTLFRIGSVIKSMTAIAAAQLTETGKLNLDLPIQEYVPEFPVKRAPITTRQLLSHLSGIRHYAGGEFFGREHYKDVSGGLVIFRNDPLVHLPGETYLYSSYGYNLASAVIERASGEAYLDYMKAHIFLPLGMLTTVPDNLDVIIPGRGRYYREVEGTIQNEPEVDNSYKWASGGVIGTSDDLVRFGMGLLSNQLIKQQTRDMFWTGQTTSSGEETGYGLGFRVTIDESGALWIGHGGGSVGGTTAFWIRPADGIVIAAISNLSNFDFGRVLVDLSNIFIQNSGTGE